MRKHTACRTINKTLALALLLWLCSAQTCSASEQQQQQQTEQSESVSQTNKDSGIIITNEDKSVSPSSSQPSPAGSSPDAMDSRFLKIERMRNRMLEPASAAANAAPSSPLSITTTANRHQSTAAEVALFKEQARKRMAERLTTLFDATREQRRSREEAKKMVRDRLTHHQQFQGLEK